MDGMAVRPAGGPLRAVVRLPGSKSLTNRALIVAALADGRTALHGALFCEDTAVMIDCLTRLGVEVEAEPAAGRISIEGCRGSLSSEYANLSCGNSGTTIRFCTALCALGAGEYLLDGIARMRERPIGALVEVMQAQGAWVDYADRTGYPPVIVRGGGYRGGPVVFEAPESSQYVSALLMVGPYARNDLLITVLQAVSLPYLRMTTRLMDDFGVAALEEIRADEARFVVPATQRYTGRDYAIEPDASNASYFLAAAAVAGGTVRVEGLGTASVQGDVKFVDLLEQMGCRVERGEHHLLVAGPAEGARLRGLDVDLNAMPDMVQTLAVVALFADGPTTVRNVANLRVKETDRLAALATELRRMGAEVEERADGLTIRPPRRPVAVRVATYGDHRMAMSFALAGLVVPGVEIADPACVNKTFPDFFERFAELHTRD